MRIAYFSPINPQPSGISDYSEALIPHLARLVDEIDLFIDGYQPTARFDASNLRIRPWQEFEPNYRAGLYDAVLYHIGNNPFHVYIYDLALRIPGVLMMHEFNLHYLVAYATIVRKDWEGYFHEIVHDAGPEALGRARQAQAGSVEPDYERVALNRTLLERSQAAIVHSEYMVGLLQGTGISIPVRRIPHGVEIPQISRSEARRRLAATTGWLLEDSTPVFGIFGFLKPYKRIHESLRAFARFRGECPQARMVLGGEEHPHYPLRPLIEELGLTDAVRISGHIPLDQFTLGLAAVDVCINLRRPTVGETSGSMLRALSLGKPTLVSEIGAFNELPADAAIKIPVDDHEENWIYEYLKLLTENPQLARAVGERGRAYVESTSLWPKVAEEYMRFLEECSRNRAMPAMSGSNGSGTRIEKLPPAQLDDDELAEYIVGFGHSSRIMEEYVQSHLTRLVRTVQITPRGDAEDRILELGCYLQITPALQSRLGYGEVRGAYYGRMGDPVTRSTQSVTGEVFSCLTDLFDAERDRYPYSDGTFNTVLCCELIEHLQNDPMHMLAEINRIVAPGGYLLLSTPNITCLRSVWAVLHGYHPGLFPSYIKPAPDGTIDPRHSREYAPREVALLAEAAGFHVELLETGPYSRLEPSSERNMDEPRRVLEMAGVPTALRGEVIYCVARKVGPVRERWPKEIYYP